MQHVSKDKKQPFFARFLEGQFPRVKSDVRAGRRGTLPDADQLHTMKYPSDDDENPPDVS